MPRKNKQRRNQRNSSNNNIDNAIVASHRSGAVGDILFPKTDLTRKQLSWRLTQHPPKNFLSAITWIQETFELTYTQAAAGGFGEIGIQFAIGSLPGASRMSALFDQYAVYSAHVRMVPEAGNSGSATATQPNSRGTYISCLDYDSMTALGSFALLQSFQNAVESETILGKSYERYVKPAAALVTGSSNSTSSTGTAADRVWVNSAFQNTPWFGYRAGYQGNTTGITVVYRLIITMVIGLRNSI